MTPARRAFLAWHTLRYVPPGQVLSRLRLRASRGLREAAPRLAAARAERVAKGLRLTAPSAGWRNAAEISLPVSATELDAAARRGAEAIEGRFTFLNVSAALGRPVQWDDTARSQLWRFHLQYGGYLVDRVVADRRAWPAVEAMMAEWAAANPFGVARDAWHPFVVSERVVNWMLALLVGPAAPRDAAPAVLDSLAVQCSFLRSNLERDVRGNHLLKNYKAMAIAGCFWSGDAAAAWRSEYPRAFAAELERQLLADGAHYERSPMYHLLVLEDVLELLAVARAFGVPAPGNLAACARAMVEYLDTITHPDGEIALFNDSVTGEASRPAMLRQLARVVLDNEEPQAALAPRHAVLAAAMTSPALPSSAPFVAPTRESSGLMRVGIGIGEATVILDVGRACPDELPAHAHADLFSFEISLGDERVIVDSGVGEYAAGEWREYYRSTRAHNTVAIDGQDQIECWGSFRVARRASIDGPLAFEGPMVSGVSAAHDGYRRLPMPVTVRRLFVELDRRAWLVVDGLTGAGPHRWESCLHAAPHVTISVEGARATFQGTKHTLSLVAFGPVAPTTASAQLRPRQGWYAPEFGKHLPAPVLVLSGSGALPATIGYLMAPNCPSTSLSVEPIGDGIMVGVGEARYCVHWDETRCDVSRVH